MELSNSEWVGRTLDLLNVGLYKIVERVLRAEYHSDWLVHATTLLGPDPIDKRHPQDRLRRDPEALLQVVSAEGALFGLGPFEHQWLKELHGAWICWAHRYPISTIYAESILLTSARLLKIMGEKEARNALEELHVAYTQQALRLVDAAAKEVPEHIPELVNVEQPKAPLSEDLPTQGESQGNNGQGQRLNQVMGWARSQALLLEEELPALQEPAPPAIQEHPDTFTVVTLDTRGRELNRQICKGNVYTQSLDGSVVLEMIPIPRGSFEMGSPPTELGRTLSEGPLRLVHVPNFYMSRYPISQAQWWTVATLPQVNLYLDPDPACFKGMNRPVEKISWYEAVEFCDRLSQKTGQTYRLPSEAEWEYACRAGTKTPFHFGETITTDLANFWGAGVYGSASKGIERGETTPHDTFPHANAFGLCDVHGNVMEWCADPWHWDYQGAPRDHQSWEAGGEVSRRVYRGGDWDSDPKHCRSAARQKAAPNDRSFRLGFRVVMEING